MAEVKTGCGVDFLRRAAREWGWIDQAPPVRLYPEPTRRIRWLTREQAERLLALLRTPRWQWRLQLIGFERSALNPRTTPAAPHPARP